MKEMLGKMKNGVLGKIGRGILDVVFPVRCVGCGEEGQYICRRCEGFISEAALMCPVCQQSSLTGERHENCRSLYGLDGLASMWEYEGVVKSLLHHIKYNGMTHAVAETVQNACMNMAEDTVRFGEFLAYLFSRDTYVTYAPMFKKKEKVRGFNQAAVLAKEIGKIAKKEVLPLLQKIKDTHPQMELDKEQRLQNVKDSFAVSVQPPKRVVLVDDIWTTGATMKECAKELKKNGVKEVWGFTLARTV